MTQPAHEPPTLDDGARVAEAPAADEAAAEAAASSARRQRDERHAALLAAATAGDGSAFETFYEQTFACARTVARRLLRDAAEVEDLLADCYFEAWRSLTRFDPARGSALTWLLTIVRSRGLDALRAAAARPARAGHDTADALVPAFGEEAGTASAAAEQHDDGADPVEQLWRRQAGAGLLAALTTLSAAERWVLGLAYLREMSHAEIARTTGMPLGTVKSHALRGQQKLRTRLACGTMPGADPAAASPAAAR